MVLPKAWYKLTYSKSYWHKIPLAEDLTDLKKVVEKEASPKLDASTALDLTLKVVNKSDDINQAVELGARCGGTSETALTPNVGSSQELRG